MRHHYVTICFVLVLQSCTYSQGNKKDLFVKSFPAITKNIVSASDLLFEGTDMDTPEAIEYVYEGDTTKLYCINEEFDMLTEQVINYYKVDNLPRKNGKFSTDSINLLFYSTKYCPDPKSLTFQILYLDIYNMKNKSQEKIIIHKESEFDTNIASLINFQNMIIFTYSFDKKERRKEFRLLRINQAYPYITEIQKAIFEVPTDNLLESLELIGWLDDFNK